MASLAVIPQILGVHFQVLDLLSRGCVLVPSFSTVDPVPRTSILLPVYLPVLAPCERVCLPTRAGVIGKDDEGGLKESCTP